VRVDLFYIRKGTHVHSTRLKMQDPLERVKENVKVENPYSVNKSSLLMFVSIS